MRIIDLSQTLENGMSQFPGQPVARFEKLSTVEENGCQVTDVHSVVHVGTHCDAPAHCVAGGPTIENVPLECFVGNASIIDLTAKSDREIRVEDLVNHEISPNEIVLFRTGAWRRWNTPEYANMCPFFSEEAAQWIVERHVRCVGLDFISPDPVDTVLSEVHQILLGAGVVIVENLRNLEQINGTRVFFSAAPLKLRDGDGAFARAYAVEF